MPEKLNLEQGLNQSTEPNPVTISAGSIQTESSKIQELEKKVADLEAKNKILEKENLAHREFEKYKREFSMSRGDFDEMESIRKTKGQFEASKYFAHYIRNNFSSFLN